MTKSQRQYFDASLSRIHGSTEFDFDELQKLNEVNIQFQHHVGANHLHGSNKIVVMRTTNHVSRVKKSGEDDLFIAVYSGVLGLTFSMSRVLYQ